MTRPDTDPELNHNPLSRDDLSTILINNIGQEPFTKLVNEAIKTGLTGMELYNSLVTSGAVIGVEYLQHRFTDMAKAPMAAMQRILKTIDAKLASAEGDDTLMAFAAEIRTPVVELIAEHVGTVQQDMAKRAEDAYGVPRTEFLSTQVPPIDTQEALASMGMTMALNTVQPFQGFVMVPEVGKMKCPCAYHLGKYAYENAKPSDEITKHAVTKFGSVEKAMQAYAAHVLEMIRKDIREVETSFGNLDAPDMGASNAMVEGLFTRLGSGHQG